LVFAIFRDTGPVAPDDLDRVHLISGPPYVVAGRRFVVISEDNESIVWVIKNIFCGCIGSSLGVLVSFQKVMKS
jgi:hypothetical protein